MCVNSTNSVNPHTVFHFLKTLFDIREIPTSVIKISNENCKICLYICFLENSLWKFPVLKYSLKKLCDCLYSNLLLHKFYIFSSLCISLVSTIYYIAIMLQKSFFNILSKASMSLQHFLLCFEGKNILLPNNLPLNDSLSALFLPNHNLF